MTTFRRIAVAAVFALIPNIFYAMVYRFGWEHLLHVFGFTGVGLLWNPFFLNFLLAVPFITYARQTTRGSVINQTASVVLLGIMALVCFWPSISLVLIMVSMARWSRP